MSSAGGFITVANGCILKIDALRRPIENIAVCDHIIANFKTRSGELSHGATIVGERGTSARYRVVLLGSLAPLLSPGRFWF